MDGKNLLRLDNPQPSPTAGEIIYIFLLLGAVHRPNGSGGRNGPFLVDGKKTFTFFLLIGKGISRALMLNNTHLKA